MSQWCLKHTISAICARNIPEIEPEEELLLLPRPLVRVALIELFHFLAIDGLDEGLEEGLEVGLEEEELEGGTTDDGNSLGFTSNGSAGLSVTFPSNAFETANLSSVRMSESGG